MKNKAPCYDGIIEEPVVPTDDSDKCPTDNIKYIPFADGQASVVLSDHNDHAQIEIGVCSSLHEVNANCLGPMMASTNIACE